MILRQINPISVSELNKKKNYKEIQLIVEYPHENYKFISL